jgi:F0F1-type ATP synthase assembly protein I
MSVFLRVKRLTWMVFAYQLGVGSLLGGIGLAFNRDIAVSLVIGAFICAIAQLAFALIALRPKLGDTPGRMVAAVYAGAMSKFFIAAVFFALALGLVEFLKTPTNAANMLLAYVITQLSVWVIPKV